MISYALDLNLIPGGVLPLGVLPAAVAEVRGARNSFFCFVPGAGPLAAITNPVRSLQIIPVCRRGLRAVIAELAPAADRMDLVDHEAEGMPVVTWLVVVDRSKPAVANSARTSRGLDSGAVLPALVSVLVSWVIHGKNKKPEPTITFK